jgi:uncharacterized cupin superfamily protein
MLKINLTAVPVEENKSPKGRYHLFCQDISQAMRQNNGGKTKPNTWPFEVELVRLPPRATNYPYHSHSAEWEFYMIVGGRGKLRTQSGTVEVREGDCFAHPPGEAHQIINSGATDLLYYVIASNDPSDICHYPDSKKWSLPGEEKPVRVQPMNYYEGEE